MDTANLTSPCPTASVSVPWPAFYFRQVVHVQFFADMLPLTGTIKGFTEVKPGQFTYDIDLWAIPRDIPEQRISGVAEHLLTAL